MPEFLPPAARFLPDFVVHLDLLHLFVVYVSLTFILSLLMRMRFYFSVFDIVRHVRYSCPSLFELIDEHWILCVRQGIFLRMVLYLVILLPYLFLNRFVWPEISVDLTRIERCGHGILVFEAVLAALMLTVDGVLLAQIGNVDADRIKADLNWSERWLGGNVNRLLGMLGRWNPIKRYADTQAKENLFWLNQVFRNSMSSMIFQVTVRLSVAVSLFLVFALG